MGRNSIALQPTTQLAERKMRNRWERTKSGPSRLHPLPIARRGQSVRRSLSQEMFIADATKATGAKLQEPLIWKNSHAGTEHIWVFKSWTGPRYGVRCLFLITIIILLNTSWCGLLETSTHWTIKPIPSLTIIITVGEPEAISWIWHISRTHRERLSWHRAGLIKPPEDHHRLIETLWLVRMNKYQTVYIWWYEEKDIEYLYGLKKKQTKLDLGLPNRSDLF